MTTEYAYLAGLIVGIAIGMVLLAFVRDDRIATLKAQLRGARKDAADAGYRAAVAVEQVEHARAEIEWFRGRIR